MGKSIKEAFANEDIPSEIVNQWENLEESRSAGKVTEIYEICEMTMADENQIVKLLSKEVGCMHSNQEIYSNFKRHNERFFSQKVKKYKDLAKNN